MIRLRYYTLLKCFSSKLKNCTICDVTYRDPKWTLNDHVKSLYSKHKCWRIVYWSLWSECHFMRCSRCQHMYPVKNQRWCQFHTQLPHYYPVENNRYLYYPIGKIIYTIASALLCTVFILGMKRTPLNF